MSGWLSTPSNSLTKVYASAVSMLYGILVEFCTQETCPIMSAGPKYEYLWADGHNVKTPLKVCASEYIEFLMTWVENQLSNEVIFPCKPGNIVMQR